MSMSAPTSALSSASTTERILAAAEELFVARSYADVTIDQVAEAAQVTKGAVYHHFSSKPGLYLRMLLDDLADKRERHERAAASCGSARERLRALTHAFLSLPPTKRRLIGLIRRDTNVFGEPMRGDLVRAYQRALPDPIQGIIRDGIRAGEIIPCDARLLAWQYIAVVEVLLTPYADHRFATMDDKLDYALGTFLDGCGRIPRTHPATDSSRGAP